MSVVLLAHRADKVKIQDLCLRRFKIVTKHEKKSKYEGEKDSGLYCTIFYNTEKINTNALIFHADLEIITNTIVLS